MNVNLKLNSSEFGTYAPQLLQLTDLLKRIVTASIAENSSQKQGFEMSLGSLDVEGRNNEHFMWALATLRETDSLGSTSSAAFDFYGRLDAKLRAYSDRIDYLQICATDEGYKLNSKSKDDFWDFIKSMPNLRRGDLVLLENGNLRVIWSDEYENQMGLQFLGGGMLQYVIFRQRPSAQGLSHAYGQDDFEGIKQQINTFNLDSVFCE